jgi:hypothetical protein
VEGGLQLLPPFHDNLPVRKMSFETTVSRDAPRKTVQTPNQRQF